MAYLHLHGSLMLWSFWTFSSSYYYRKVYLKLAFMMVSLINWLFRKSVCLIPSLLQVHGRLHLPFDCYDVLYSARYLMCGWKLCPTVHLWFWIFLQNKLTFKECDIYYGSSSYRIHTHAMIYFSQWCTHFFARSLALHFCSKRGHHRRWAIDCGLVPQSQLTLLLLR